MRIYRNVFRYEQLFLLFRRLTSVEHLTLMLAIGVARHQPDHFIDGFDLQRDIVLFMPHLCQFNFHIRSILKNPPHVNINLIRQSFTKDRSAVDCALDYFANNYGQCQIYSRPFVGTRLDFISNRFPLFDIQNTFANVTALLLFDDREPFESGFFERVARTLPRLKTLDIFNYLEQGESEKIARNLIEFPRLTTLILHNIHVHYAEQLLYRSHLPCLFQLIIRNDSLLSIINDNNRQAKINCAKVENLQIIEPRIKPSEIHFDFFPSLSVLRNS